MGRRKTSSGSGLLALLLLALIGAAVQFIGEHLTEIATAAAIVGVLWGAYALTRSNKKRDIPAPEPNVAVVSEPDVSTFRRYRIPALSVDGSAYWSAPGTTVRVRDREIGGMLYCGTGLQAIGSEQPEPALIDPRLPVARGVDEYRERRLEYWPSYSTASGIARACYLNWLQHGRSDPAADIGYVFLYFYGLERRALQDARTNPVAAEEIPAIEAEVSRLLAIYTGSASFQRYASDFLDYVRVRRQSDQSYLAPPLPGTRKGLSFCDRLALAQCAHDGASLPAQWAYHWVTHDSSTSLGVAARRCPEQFQQLFTNLYQARWDTGLVLPQNRTRLTFEYRPASASLRGAHEGLVYSPSLSDVTVLTGPVNKLADVVAQVCEQLAAFSRMIGKDPSSATSFEALVQLPVSLWPLQYREQLESVRDIVARAGQPAAIPLSKFLSWIPEVAELTRPKLKALARALAGFGLAMEPDLRFGGTPPALDSRIVVFADDPATTTEEASPRYQAAALAIQLAVAIAMADGAAGELERGLLSEQVRLWPGLSESERRRLAALLRLMILQGPKLAGLRKKVESLKPSVREAMGDFLVEVAQADNQVTPEEIKTLQKIFSLLGLDADRVYSKVHAAAVAAPEPPRVDGKRGSASFAIPSAPPQRARPKSPGSTAKPPATLKLDPARIAALQQDSERVSKLLESVFEIPPAPEEPSDAPEQHPEEAVVAPTLLGLDKVHSQLLQTLVNRVEWKRIELEELAQDRGLMVDGALERLNDASFDLLEMPLFDDGDPIRMNPEALTRISSGDYSRA